MKHVPEIAPEIRGLMEEIVADPRSRMRIAPRRALLDWFATDETIRPREIPATKAERHLIAVHREALAELLREAAWIAYWKAPKFSYKPVGADGRLYHPASVENAWRERASRYLPPASERGTMAALLAECLVGLEASAAHTLARASLSLVANDKTRCYLGLSIAWDSPRAALSVFRRLLERRLPRSLSDKVLTCVGARLCALGALEKAREVYSRVARGETEALHGRIYSFNLSCFLGDTRRSIEEARSLEELHIAPDVVEDEREILRVWALGQCEGHLDRARRVLRQVTAELPPAALALSKALAT